MPTFPRPTGRQAVLLAAIVLVLLLIPVVVLWSAAARDDRARDTHRHGAMLGRHPSAIVAAASPPGRTAAVRPAGAATPARRTGTGPRRGRRLATAVAVAVD